jgi:hypothetical protein
MNNYLIFLLSIIFLLNVNSFSQKQDCKVLLETIAENYEGECRGGLAYGRGMAIGVDSYEGKFKNGLPHGTGVYTWQSGESYTGSFKNGKRNGLGKLRIADGTLISEGSWKDDKFIKEKEVPDYKITTKRNVLSVTLNDLGSDINRIEIVLTRDGRESTVNLHDLMIVTTSGVEMNNNNSFVYTNAHYPFNANIKFRAAGRMSKTTVQGTKVNMEISQMLDCLVDLEILEKGNWQVRIRY